jgi:hypothetical protein
MPDVKKLLSRAYKAVKTDEGYDILGRYGWLDGGCWELAQAVKDVYPEARLIAVKQKGKNYVDHVAVKWGPFVLDGSGVKSMPRFKQYWSSDPVDGLGEIDVVPFDSQDVIHDSPPCDPYKVKQIRSLILREPARTARKVTGKTTTHHRSGPIGLSGIR